MADDFRRFSTNLDSPGRDAFHITPSDDSDLDTFTRGVYVGVGGNIAATMVGGGIVTFFGVVSGSVLPLRFSRVSATGTTASNLIGLI